MTVIADPNFHVTFVPEKGAPFPKRLYYKAVKLTRRYIDNIFPMNDHHQIGKPMVIENCEAK